MHTGLPRPPRSLLGAPRQRGLSNPTVALFVVTTGLFSLASAGALTGAIPWWVASGLNFVCLYAIYTVSHEAVHHTAHPNRRINDWMGRIAVALEGLTFPLFRVIHLQHHAFTNDPVKDPDYVIGRTPRWLLPLWTLIRLTHDNAFMIRRGLWARNDARLAEHLATLAVQLTVAALFVAAGYFRELLALWVLPLVGAGMAIELTVAWAVHYPHESRHPLENTRLYTGRIWQVLSLNQSYHLIHHLWPRIPWFRYQEMEETVRHAVGTHQREGSD